MTATCKDKLAEEVSSKGQVMVDDSIYLSIYIYIYGNNVGLVMCITRGVSCRCGANVVIFHQQYECFGVAHPDINMMTCNIGAAST